MRWGVLESPISYRYLVDPVETREALSVFARQEIIGLDTETYFDYETRQYRLSLLQLAAPSGEMVVVDALAAGIDEARVLVEDAAVMMAAHNARYDEGALQGAGFAPQGFVDTLKLARRALRLPSFSLASVAANLCNLTLDKTFQQSDWRRRPLSREQLDYAALDAQIALRVYQELAARLSSEGCWEQELARARLRIKDTQSTEPHTPKSRETIALRPLTSDERAQVEQLRHWRRREAVAAGVPSYLVCSDKTLEHLVIARPQSSDQLSDIYGLGPAKILRYGEALLEQLKLVG